MACEKCGQPAGQCSFDCETVSRPFECCPTPEPVIGPICDFKAATIDCVAENRSIFQLSDTIGGGGDACPCIPCPEEIAFSPEQKAYLAGVFDGLIKTLIPAVVCDCEVQPIIGHMWPVKPTQTAPRLDANGNPTGCHDATGPNNCCGPFGSLAHSPFISNGNYNIHNHPYATGRPSMPGLDMMASSREGMDALLKVLCCTRDTVLGADDIELVPAP